MPDSLQSGESFGDDPAKMEEGATEGRGKDEVIEGKRKRKDRELLWLT